MKKSILSNLTLIFLTALCIMCCSCAHARSKINESGTAIGSLAIETHFNESEPKESESTEISTAPETKTETEEPTETETETQAPAKVIESLRFISYGNGTCAVTGIGNCTDLCIVIPERSSDGDIVTAIEGRAFYGNTEIKAVEIPSTITSIGSEAFGGCTSLVYISVDKNNKSFTDIDGILFSIDRKNLLAYPSACGASEIRLSKEIVSIADMAFFGCDSLKTIIFDGTLSDWGDIDIGDMNYGLFTSSVQCLGGK
jgi:hypothetical protein